MIKSFSFYDNNKICACIKPTFMPGIHVKKQTNNVIAFRVQSQSIGFEERERESVLNDSRLLYVCLSEYISPFWIPNEKDEIVRIKLLVGSCCGKDFGLIESNLHMKTISETCFFLRFISIPHKWRNVREPLSCLAPPTCRPWDWTSYLDASIVSSLWRLKEEELFGQQ